MAEVARRKVVEEALRTSEQRMRLVIESSPVGIRVARNGKYIYCNPALVRMFEYASPDDILGLPVPALYAPEQAELIRALARDPEKDLRVPAYYEVEGVKKTGERFDLAVWVAETEYDGQPSILGFLIDISEAKRLRAQLMHAQKMEAVGLLAGGVAHDFNNLLTVIQGFADLVLSDKGQDHPDYDDLQRIAQSARKGADLVHSLLAFSRKVEINLKPVKLNQAIEQLRRLLLRTLPKMIEIKTFVPDDLKLVHADVGQIDQVVLNLAVNAKDAMPDGGTLVITCRNVDPRDEKLSHDHRDQTRPIRTSFGFGYRSRHEQGRTSSNIRAFLHHQGAQRRHGSRSRHGIRHHKGTWRSRHLLQ